MTAHPIAEGALARLTRDTDGYRAGFELVIDEYVEPRPEAEREPGEIDAPIYYGNAHGGAGNVCVPADAVEIVKTAEAMAARQIPTLNEIAQELGITDGWSDRFEINEWIRSGTEIECYATTNDGLPFGFTVKITAAWETDL